MSETPTNQNPEQNSDALNKVSALHGEIFNTYTNMSGQIDADPVARHQIDQRIVTSAFALVDQAEQAGDNVAADTLLAMAAGAAQEQGGVDAAMTRLANRRTASYKAVGDLSSAVHDRFYVRANRDQFSNVGQMEAEKAAGAVQYAASIEAGSPDKSIVLAFAAGAFAAANRPEMPTMADTMHTMQMLAAELAPPASQ